MTSSRTYAERLNRGHSAGSNSEVRRPLGPIPPPPLPSRVSAALKRGQLSDVAAPGLHPRLTRVAPRFAASAPGSARRRAWHQQCHWTFRSPEAKAPECQRSPLTANMVPLSPGSSQGRFASTPRSAACTSLDPSPAAHIPPPAFRRTRCISVASADVSIRAVGIVVRFGSGGAGVVSLLVVSSRSLLPYRSILRSSSGIPVRRRHLHRCSELRRS